MVHVSLEQPVIDSLLRDGVVYIDLNPYVKQAEKLLKQGCQSYTKQLSAIFSANPDNFKDSDFQITPGTEISLSGVFQRRIQSANTELFSLMKEKEGSELIVSLLVEAERTKVPTEMVRDVIGNAIVELLFGERFPKPFIASAERTGAAIFRKELNFARNRLLEEMSQTDKNIDPMALLFKVYQDYALPVERNVDFTRQLESVAKKKSFLAEQHKNVLEEFADIIGGEYNVTRDDELYFKPKGKRVRLTMDESSSAVRSLLDIGFYLRHVARPGDLLMIDEPELNLHPENQRRIARLFARLVNLGIKVFLTTHSDYIVKELNTLIMLNQSKPHLKEIAEQEGYRKGELIRSEQVKVYIAKDDLVKLDENTKRSRCQTLVAAKINQETGVDAPSFDGTINTMNRIQEAIIWGGGES